MKYQIERGKPMPKTTMGAPRTNPLRDPLDKMEVGDSILLQMADMKNLQNAILGIRYHADGRKFMRRTSPEGLRVWRIA